MTFNVEEKLFALLSKPDEHADFGTLASAGGTVGKCTDLIKEQANRMGYESWSFLDAGECICGPQRLLRDGQDVQVHFLQQDDDSAHQHSQQGPYRTLTVKGHGHGHRGFSLKPEYGFALQCGKDVASFFVMFAIVFLAFAQLGNLLFGTQVTDFASFDESIFTLLRTILGDFNFHAIQKADRLLGPVFFVSYVLFVFFILMNIFLAIINDTYSLVKTEIAVQKNDVEISEFMMRGYNNLVGNMGQRDREVDLENALLMSRADNGDINYEELRHNLKKLDFADMEIEMFFAR